MRRRFRMAPKAPKVQKVKPVALPKPQPHALKDIYRKLVASNITMRIAAFEEALAWYDTAIPYFLSKKSLDAKQQKFFALANKTRTTAVIGAANSTGSNQQAASDNEREVAYKATIQLYEKIWPNVTKVSSFWNKYESQKSMLATREAALTSRYNIILDPLNQAFGKLGTGLSFIVQKSAKPRQFDGTSTIILSDTLAKVLLQKAKAEGLLPVLFSEAHTALYAASIERGPDNQPVTKLDKLARLVPQMLEAILRYCNSVPRNKVFRGFDDNASLTAKPTDTVAKPARQPRQPGTPRPAGSKPVGRAAAAKVGFGRYLETSAMGIIFTRLTDQKPHTTSDLFAGLSTGDPMGRLKWIVKHGKDSGDWSVTVQGDKVHMVLNKPV